MKIQEIREIAETRKVGARSEEGRLNESQMIFPLFTKRTNGQTCIQNMILSNSNVKDNWSAHAVTNY